MCVFLVFVVGCLRVGCHLLVDGRWLLLVCSLTFAIRGCSRFFVLALFLLVCFVGVRVVCLRGCVIVLGRLSLVVRSLRCALLFSIVACCGLFVVWLRLLVGCSLLVVSCPLCVVCCSLSVDSELLLAVSCSLWVV